MVLQSGLVLEVPVVIKSLDGSLDEGQQEISILVLSDGGDRLLDLEELFF